MRLPSFEYLEPKTIREACKLLAQFGPEARVLAGGTDLLIKMKNKEVRPGYLIGLKAIEGLDQISHQPGKGLKIGAMVTLEAIRNSQVVKEKCPVLAETASLMASTQVRNLGTAVGNICNAAPSADMAPPLIALGAKLRVAGGGRARQILVEDLFSGPELTTLEAGEIITEILVPDRPAGCGCAYLKQTIRRAMDLSLVSAAAFVAVNTKGACRDIRIALGTSAPTPIRAKGAEEHLRGKVIDATALEKASEIASQEARSRSSVRASEEYRRKVVGVLVKRSVTQALSRASASGGSVR